VNCTICPTGAEGFEGVTLILVSKGRPTEKVAFAVTDPDVAVTVALPAAIPTASPAVSIVATAGADDVHVTVFVMLPVVPSEKIPVAVNCCLCPTRIEALLGVTRIDVSVAATA
jgi:hypothetical protein